MKLRSTRENGKHHREASRWKGAPSWAWVTRCGWRFGLSEHYEFVSETEARDAGPLWCDKGCDVEWECDRVRSEMIWHSQQWYHQKG